VEDETAVQLNKQWEDCDAIVDEVMAVNRVVTEASIRKLAQGWSPTTQHKFGITEETEEATEILSDLQLNHNVAKAVKSDNARVPVELWDGAVCRHTPTVKQQQALSIIREFALRLY
jgi:hypothetical protein